MLSNKSDQHVGSVCFDNFWQPFFLTNMLTTFESQKNIPIQIPFWPTRWLAQQQTVPTFHFSPFLQNVGRNVGQHVVRFAPAFKQVIQKLFVSILTGVTSRGSRSFISNLVSGWNFKMAENIANNWDVYTPLNCGSRDLGPTWRGIILSDNASYIFYITFITDWLRI